MTLVSLRPPSPSRNLSPTSIILVIILPAELFHPSRVVLFSARSSLSSQQTNLGARGLLLLELYLPHLAVRFRLEQLTWPCSLSIVSLRVWPSVSSHQPFLCMLLKSRSLSIVAPSPVSCNGS